MLQNLLTHLLHPSPPPSLAQIVIVWQNVGEPLPAFLQPGALEALAASTGMGVYVRRSERNSMNERFRPLLDWGHEIETRAVMILDDDVVLTKDTLEWGWYEWRRANPTLPPSSSSLRRAGRGGRLVGFTGRDFRYRSKKSGEGPGGVAGQEGPGRWEYVIQPELRYGLVLSNAAWMKTEWLEHYWADTHEMKKLRGHVDEGRSTP